MCELKKDLYGLKKRPREWNLRTDGCLISMGFIKDEVDSNFYFLLFTNGPLILVLYVDDPFLIGLEKLIKGCKIYLDLKFKAKNIGLMHYFLGLEV